VLQPERLGAAAREDTARLHPEILVVVAYGRIFGPKFLSLFPRGGINLHPSLLPRWRGPSPIPAAILSGDEVTGITVQRLAERMDAGDILIQVPMPLSGTETTASLTLHAADRGAELVLEALSGIERGTLAGVPQNEADASYCRLITKADGLVRWQDSAVTIERMIRAYDPWPRARTVWNGTGLSLLSGGVYTGEPMPRADGRPGTPEPGEVLGIDTREGILVQTGNGILAVRELQLQAKKALEWRAFLNGVRDFIGTVLGGGDA
jgi:methionyl-tRNA formyltransferase